MLDCFGQLRARGYQSIVLMGSDSPDVPLGYLREAFELLDSTLLALGESDDGGFYLLGASTALPESIFNGITWSSAEVTSHLRRNLQDLALTSRELQAWRDVDEEGDVVALRHRLFELGTHAPHTREFLLKTR
jgi:glycosyltransferase A (GT-A) superfamily protein (DUF2064 family)